MDRLRASIPEPRLAPYILACAGTSVDPIALYLWAKQVSLAVFDDIATLKVAMRSAMARELSSTYGINWYQNAGILDDETLRLINTAWRTGRLGQIASSPDVVHGKLVSSLMFGFWVKVLGRGGYQGQGAERQRRIYDTVLWKSALRQAFPMPEISIVHVSKGWLIESRYCATALPTMNMSSGVCPSLVFPPLTAQFCEFPCVKSMATS